MQSTLGVEVINGASRWLDATSRFELPTNPTAATARAAGRSALIKDLCILGSMFQEEGSNRPSIHATYYAPDLISDASIRKKFASLSYFLRT